MDNISHKEMIGSSFKLKNIKYMIVESGLQREGFSNIVYYVIAANTMTKQYLWISFSSGYLSPDLLDTTSESIDFKWIIQFYVLDSKPAMRSYPFPFPDQIKAKLLKTIAPTQIMHVINQLARNYEYVAPKRIKNLLDNVISTLFVNNRIYSIEYKTDLRAKTWLKDKTEYQMIMCLSNSTGEKKEYAYIIHQTMSNPPFDNAEDRKRSLKTKLPSVYMIGISGQELDDSYSLSFERLTIEEQKSPKYEKVQEKMTNEIVDFFGELSCVDTYEEQYDIKS